nr:mitochondrial inner membrane protease ATP23-like [Ipomoea batatas]
MDWGNRTHRACTEIRASRLSGDCHFLRELLRGNFKIIGHEQACVKRRVVNSMTGTNTNCSKIAATIAMEVVWDTCYNDTAPFDKAH